MSPASMRCFLAVFLSTDVRNRLAREIRRLQTAAEDVKWVDGENLHVTLKFLGQMTQGDVVQLTRALPDLAGGFAPHVAQVRGLGAFPSLATPRTIWAGFAAGGDEFTRLGRAIEDSCSQWGFKREHRPFTPHITLGRRRAQSTALDLAERLRESAESDFGTLAIDEFSLVASNLRRAGPVYVPIATIPLAGRK